MTSNKTFTDINENLSRSNRIKELDLARGYSILFVIATHISFFADLVFHRLFYNFPVPFFFFASSFSLTIKYKEEEKIDLKKFYKNRFHFYLPIYFLYAFIIVFIKKVVFGHYSFGAFILDYLLNASLGRIPTIWFLYVLFFFYLIFPFFLKVMKISSKFIILTLFAMSVIILTIFYSNNTICDFFCMGNIFSFEINSYSFSVNILKIYFFLFMMPFFILGYIFGSNYITIKKFLNQNRIFYFISISYILFVILLYVNQNYIKTNFYNLAYSTYFSWVNLYYSLFTIVFLLTFFIKFKRSRFFDFNARYSSNIFLIQRPIILLIAPIIFYGTFHDPIFEAFLFLFPFLNNSITEMILYNLINFSITYFTCLILIIGGKAILNKLKKSYSKGSQQ